MKVQPWMVGAGIVVVGGTVVYLATRKKAAAVAPATLTQTVAPGAAPHPPAPLIIPLRPIASSTAGTFSSNPPPPGLVLTVGPNVALSAPLTAAAPNVTIELPAGGQWDAVVTANSSDPNTAIAQINLNGDTTAPIALTEHDLVGANVIVAKWTDSKGTYLTTVSTPLVAAPKPLTLHL